MPVLNDLMKGGTCTIELYDNDGMMGIGTRNESMYQVSFFSTFHNFQVRQQSLRQSINLQRHLDQ